LKKVRLFRVKLVRGICKWEMPQLSRQFSLTEKLRISSRLPEHPELSGGHVSSKRTNYQPVWSGCVNSASLFFKMPISAFMRWKRKY